MTNITSVDHGELPSYIYIILSIVNIIFAIFIVFFNTMLWLYLREAKTPSVIFIKAILLVSTPAIFIGLPLQIAMFTGVLKSFSYLLCNRAHVISLSSIMTSSLMALWQLSGMALQRYCFIANKNYLLINSHKKIWVLLLLAIGAVTAIIISYEVSLQLDNRELGKCVIDYKIEFSKCSGKSCTYYVVTIVITITQIICNTTISIATLKLRSHIRNHERKTMKLLGSMKVTNLERLRATHYIWIAFMIFWIPWGLTRALYNLISNPVVAVILNDVCHTVSYFCLVAVALVYAKMDKGFHAYIQKNIELTKFERKKVEQNRNAVMRLS